MLEKKHCRFCGFKLKCHRFNYGPLCFHFCSEAHEEVFWWIWRNDLKMYKWIRSDLCDRNNSMIDSWASPKEKQHAERVLKVLKRHPPLHRREKKVKTIKL